VFSVGYINVPLYYSRSTYCKIRHVSKFTACFSSPGYECNSDIMLPDYPYLHQTFRTQSSTTSRTAAAFCTTWRHVATNAPSETVIRIIRLTRNSSKIAKTILLLLNPSETQQSSTEEFISDHNLREVRKYTVSRKKRGHSILGITLTNLVTAL